jgi:hypothetical protein
VHVVGVQGGRGPVREARRGMERWHGRLGCGSAIIARQCSTMVLWYYGIVVTMGQCPSFQLSGFMLHPDLSYILIELFAILPHHWLALHYRLVQCISSFATVVEPDFSLTS